MRKLIHLTLVALLVGCASETSITHYSRDVALSIGREVAIGTLTVRLVSVAPDGAAAIELLGSPQRFTAKPGDYYVSEALGAQGLQLLSASPEKKEAVVRQRWADSN